MLSRNVALSLVALSFAAPLAACGSSADTGNGDDGGGSGSEAGADTSSPPPPGQDASSADAGHPQPNGDAAPGTDGESADTSPGTDAETPDAEATDAGDGASSDGTVADGGDGASTVKPDAEVLAEAGDYGGDSAAFPAFPVDYPQVAANHGYHLGTPVIVTITWPSDPQAATWEDFGDKLGPTTYWASATAEYGVGATTSGAKNHIRLTETAPATIGADALAAFVAANAGAASSDAGPAWPAPTLDGKGDDQTIYSLIIPPGMDITDPGTGATFCAEGAGGYHDDVLANGKPISYSVSLQCSGFTARDVEETMAHEYAEAATDPYPSFPNTNAPPTELGYVGFDANHLSWDVYTGFQDELGDACEFWRESYYQETGTFPYWVQRIWSNKAAAAGHNPCAPQPSGAYFGMTLFPSQESDVTIDLTSIGDTKRTSKGFHAVVGQSVTFQVGFFSDAPAAPWTIAYDFQAQTNLFDTAGNPIGNGAATVTIDHPTGVNGDKAYVTVTPTTAGQLGFQSMAITWDQPLLPDGGPSQSTPRYLPILIVNQ